MSRTEYIKENWYKWVNVSTFAVVLGYVVYGAKWQQRVDSHVESSKTFRIKTEERFKEFVPRVELEGRLKNIETLLIESKSDQKVLNNLLIEFLRNK